MFTVFIELVTLSEHIGYQNTIIFAIQWQNFGEENTWCNICNVNSVMTTENKLAAGTAWGMRRYHVLLNVSNNYTKHLLLGSQCNIFASCTEHEDT